jgi:D-3-phosphoglycerate dehydrogenase / 2-oxoglutarate reductase
MKAKSTIFEKRKIRVLCPEPQNYSPQALKQISQFTDFNSLDLSQDEFEKMYLDYDVLMVRLKCHVTTNMITSSTRLKAILSPTTGVDHIDMETAKNNNIAVFCLKGETSFLKNIHSSAEFTFGLLLSLVRNIPQAVTAVINNSWEQSSFRGIELHNKRLGIIGFGRIGKKVARYGRGFGMKVYTYDPFIEKFPKYVKSVDSLDCLLKNSDALCVCVPLNNQTEGLIGEHELSLLPTDSYLINTSRGNVINESALLKMLETGHIAGAAVDVLTNEILIQQEGHSLIDYAKAHSNLIITPHIAGTAIEAIEKTDFFVIEMFSNWLATLD